MMNGTKEVFEVVVVMVMVMEALQSSLRIVCLWV